MRWTSRRITDCGAWSAPVANVRRQSVRDGAVPPGRGQCVRDLRDVAATVRARWEAVAGDVDPVAPGGGAEVLPGARPACSPVHQLALGRAPRGLERRGGVADGAALAVEEALRHRLDADQTREGALACPCHRAGGRRSCGAVGPAEGGGAGAPLCPGGRRPRRDRCTSRRTPGQRRVRGADHGADAGGAQPARGVGPEGPGHQGGRCAGTVIAVVGEPGRDPVDLVAMRPVCRVEAMTDRTVCGWRTARTGRPPGRHRSSDRRGRQWCDPPAGGIGHGSDRYISGRARPGLAPEVARGSPASREPGRSVPVEDQLGLENVAVVQPAVRVGDGDGVAVQPGRRRPPSTG